MASGGKREGSGRPARTPNKVSTERVQRAAAEGPLPAENLNALARTATSMAARYQRLIPDDITKADPKVVASLKEWMQLAGQLGALAAPYFNYRLSAVKIEDRRVDLTQLTDKELEQFESLYARASAPRSGAGGESASRH